MDMQDLEQMRRATVIDRNGEKIGRVDEIYLDRDTDEPEWVLVNTGLFGSRSTFVPLRGAVRQGSDLRVDVEKSAVKQAPGVEPGRELSQQEEAELYGYYGMEYSEARSDSGLAGSDPGGGSDYTQGQGDRATVGHDVSGPETDDAMTRSEEELRVGTRQEAAGRLRLRKHVVTEPVTETVPVQREEVRVEREPITEANRDAAMEGSDISEEEHEVVLHEEVPVTQKEAVPVERVRLDKDVVTEQEQVSEEVRKEQIDVEDDQHPTSS